MPEQPMGLSRHVAGASARVVTTVKLAMVAVPFGIVEAATCLAVLVSDSGLAGEQTSRPGAVVGLQTQSLVSVICGQLLQTMGKFAALDHPAPAIGRHPKPKD